MFDMCDKNSLAQDRIKRSAGCLRHQRHGVLEGTLHRWCCTHATLVCVAVFSLFEHCCNVTKLALLDGLVPGPAVRLHPAVLLHPTMA